MEVGLFACLEHWSPFEFQGKVHVGQCPSPFVVPSFVPFGVALCRRCMHRGTVPMFLIFLHPIVARVSWSSIDNSCTCVTGVNAGTIQCCGNRLAGGPEMW